MGLEQCREGLDDGDLADAGAALGFPALQAWGAAVDLGEGGADVDAPAGQVDVGDRQGEQLTGRSSVNRAVVIAQCQADEASSVIANASVRVRTAGWRE